MKILLYGLNFAPEPTGIGRYSGEMVAWLVQAGHEVRVLTAPPYYPQWKVGEGFKAWRRSGECWAGAWVRRVPLWVPSRPTGLTRLVHLASFAVSSLPDLLRQIRWKPDVVLVVAPALACAPAGWMAARACGAKCWLHVQDFEVDAAFRMGLLKGRWLQGAVERVERWLMRRFDRVSTISQRMMELLAHKHIEADRAVLFPNWVDLGAIMPTASAGSYRRELGLPADAVVALYSGSLVGKQGLEIISAAARALQDELPQLHFVVCGEGLYKRTLEADCAGLRNVHLLPLQPASRLNELLGTADIHLLPQNANAADLVMPSKLTGMMASGRPVIATAHPGTELDRVVRRGGRVVRPGDLAAFGEALRELVRCTETRLRLGTAARHYAEAHFARDRVLVDFELALKQCLGLVRAAPVEVAGASRHAAPVAPAAHGDESAETT